MKKEKYIVSTTKNGKEYLTVKFHYKVDGNDKQYTKSFAVSNYPTRSSCMKAACNHRDIKRAELLTVGLPSGTKKTVQECFEDYIRMYHETKSNADTLRSYFKHIEKFKDIPVNEINSLDIQNHLYSLRFDCTDNLISRICLVWKDIFKAALKEKIITSNPFDSVDIPKSKLVKESNKQMTDDKSIDMMINYFETSGRTESVRYNYQLYAHLIILMRETGMRPAECYALNRNDIDFENKVIHVKDAIGSDEKSSTVITTTKTKFSVRDIPMTSKCEECLKSLMNLTANDYLFLDYNGEFLNSRNVSRTISKTASKLGVDFHLYMLRHRFSTNLISNGVDIRTAMELMGHASPNMTISYARSNDQKKRAAINNLDTKQDELVENGRQYFNKTPNSSYF